MLIAVYDVADQHQHDCEDRCDHREDLGQEKVLIDTERIDERLEVRVGIVIEINRLDRDPFCADALLLRDQQHRQLVVIFIAPHSEHPVNVLHVKPAQARLVVRQIMIVRDADKEPRERVSDAGLQRRLRVLQDTGGDDEIVSSLEFFLHADDVADRVLSVCICSDEIVRIRIDLPQHAHAIFQRRAFAEILRVMDHLRRQILKIFQACFIAPVVHDENIKAVFL